jgi:hypothetical protein
MKAPTLGFVAIAALLAPCAWAGEAPAAAAPLLVPAKIVVPATTAIPPAANPDAGEPVVELAAVSVQAKPDLTYRKVNEALADEQRDAPCDLIVKNSARFQFRAFGPPLPPMPAETRIEQLPALFPLVTLAW